MPVSSLHSSYVAATEAWKTIGDVLGGEETVKAEGTRYLPMLGDDTTEDYERYKFRADFLDATSRTLTAMLGFLFRKDPKIMPEKEDDPALKPALKAFIEDATLTGKSLYDLAKAASEAVLAKARGAGIVDWSDVEEQPFVVTYVAEDVINWGYIRKDGRMMLSFVVFYELDDTYIAQTDSTPPIDEYSNRTYPQWRVWKLVDDYNGGHYVVSEVYRRKQIKGDGLLNPTSADLKGTGPAPGAKITSKDDFVLVSNFQPKRAGRALMEIPCVFFGTKGPDGSVVDKPPLLGMARANLSHYRTTADLKNALHLLGVPTPWAAGWDDKSDELKLGATTAWKTSNENAQCGFLELSGTGLKNLTDDLERTEKHMAALGARMLDQQNSLGRQPEAYATVALRQTGETAVLTQISLSLTQSMTDIIALAYWWCDNAVADTEAAEKVVSYTINTEFLDTSIDPSELTALMQLYIGGAISFDSLFSRLQAQEVIPGGRTVDEERQLIQDGHSMLLSLTQASQGTDPNAQPDPNADPNAAPNDPSQPTAKAAATKKQADSKKKSATTKKPAPTKGNDQKG